LSTKLFLRDATGLVRELATLDAYVLSLSIVSLGGGSAATLILLGLYPATDLPIAFTLGLIPAIAFTVVYSIMTAAFPRSGGDYVWMSRIGGAAIGFSISLAMELWLFFICAAQAWFVTWVGVPSTLVAMGLIFKVQYLAEWSSAITSSNLVAFIVASIVVILGALFCTLGARVYARIQKALWVYGMLGMAVWIGLLLTSTHAAFVSSFNSLMAGTASYEGIVKAAADQGFLKPIDIGTTLIAAIPLSWGMYAGFNYPVYLSGETKNVTRSVPIALTASILTSWVFFVAILGLAGNVFGMDFMYAISSLSAAGSPAYTLPFGPSISFLISVLTTNPFLVFVACSSLVVWWFMILPPFYMTGSRVIFAWSWDRLVPGKLADVHERLHSPMLAIMLVLVAEVIWAYVFAYQGYYLTFMNFGLVIAFGWAIPGFIAAVFPYAKKDLYQRTVGVLPRAFSRKLAGVPILTIAGLIQGVAMLFYGYASLWPTLTFVELSPAVTYAFESLIVTVVGGILYFLAVRAYRKTQGIDLGMIFSEIPPE